MLNVSIKTSQSWEQGTRKPSQAALRLIQVFRQHPSALLEIVEMSDPIIKASRRKPTEAGRKSIRS
jgi:hypothetical protein